MRDNDNSNLKLTSLVEAINKIKESHNWKPNQQMAAELNILLSTKFLLLPEDERRQHYKDIYECVFPEDCERAKKSCREILCATIYEANILFFQGPIEAPGNETTARENFKYIMKTLRETSMVRKIEEKVSKDSTLKSIYIITGADHVDDLIILLEEKNLNCCVRTYSELKQVIPDRQDGNADIIASNTVHLGGIAAPGPPAASGILEPAPSKVKKQSLEGVAITTPPSTTTAATHTKPEMTSFNSTSDIMNYLFDRNYTYAVVLNALDSIFSDNMMRDRVFNNCVDLNYVLVGIFIMNRPALSEADKAKLIKLTNELLTKNTLFTKRMFGPECSFYYDSRLKEMFPACSGVTDTIEKNTGLSQPQEGFDMTEPENVDLINNGTKIEGENTTPLGVSNNMALKDTITSPLEDFRKSLIEYKRKRMSENTNNITFFNRLFGYTKDQKIEACDQLLSCLNNNRITLSPKYLEALKQGRLGKIIVDPKYSDLFDNINNRSPEIASHPKPK